MKTIFQIKFPDLPGLRRVVSNSRGQPMDGRALPDFRPTGIPTKALTRAEWDDLGRRGGPYLDPKADVRPVPDVDFEAEDGTIHQTAEACLAHELRARFGVDSLEALAAVLSDWQPEKEAAPVHNESDSRIAEDGATDDAIRVSMLTVALSRKGLKPAEAAKATGLTSQACRELVKANPAVFVERGGKLFLV